MQADARVVKLLAKFDTNTDGSISSAEAQAVIQAAVDEKFAALLARFDTDGNGAVSAAEIAAIQAAHRGGRR